jgi:very-short-patch-repair endonuclease
MLLPDSILIEETIDKYGYDPKLFKGLKDYSKYVVRTCFDCGNIYDQQFMSVIVSLRKNKKCKYCSNKEKSTSSADRRSLSLKEKYKSGSISHPMLNRKHTDESKMKMGRDRKGKNLESIYGKSRADEIKLKISRSVSGEKNPFYGKKHSENNIPFVHQFKFNECVKITQLPFDFFLPDFNVCIEYDGEFHYLDLGFNDLKSTQENDQIKTDFCIKNGIDLIRISYLDKDNIDSILSKKFIQ